MPSHNAHRAQRKRMRQRVPPERMWPHRIMMPPSLWDSLRAKAKELGFSVQSLARIYLMQGLAGSGEPPPDWWFRVEPIDLDDDDKIVETIRLPLSVFGDIVNYQRRDGWQTRRLAIVQLVIDGLKASNNRGTGLGGRY